MVRDNGLLESALARPQATVVRCRRLSRPPTKAAALLHSLARNHALVDGNKRLAWSATYVFLGHQRPSGQSRPTTRSSNSCVAVAAGELDDVVAIAARLREWAPGDQG